MVHAARSFSRASRWDCSSSAGTPFIFSCSYREAPLAETGRTDDYARAGIPMLPVIAGKAETRRQILLYTLILVPISVLLWPLGFAGPIYGVVAIAAGVVMTLLAMQLRREQTGAG